MPGMRVRGRRMAALVIAVVLGLLALAGPAPAQSGGTVTIRGEVRDRNATGLPDVAVTLAGAQAATTVTDADGRFTFPGLPAGGTYTVAPAQATFVFAPVSRTYPALAQDTTAAFVAQAGTFTRYFAEGATSPFFDTRVALLNTTGEPTTATVRFQQPAPAAEVATTVPLGGHQRVTLDPKALGLAQAEFATVIAATQPIVADRTMTWDASGYGSHAETSVARPQTQWILAEGATIAGFALFYLIQNPGATAAEVQVRYLLPAPTPPLVKTYTVAPRSRVTIWVNQEAPALAAAEVSAAITVTNGVPVIVERAMYRAVGGQMFGAGHASAGVAAPALQWAFAEGATGPFFDLFFLIANPGDAVAQVEARYLRPDGTVVTRTYAVAASSRFTIWLDAEGPDLADTAVATTFRVTHGVPVVIERAMWWGDGGGWREGHHAAGATATGTTWALAEGEDGGPRGSETYLLIGNTSAYAGTARVTLTFEDGTQAVRDVALPATSRTNIAVRTDLPEAAGRRFGAVVESLGPTPAQLIVERAMYHNAGGVAWAAGTSAMGTRLRADAAAAGDVDAALLPTTTGTVHLPASATVVREAAQATTATVGPAGGTVTATASTGTTYTLTVPRGALRVPTAITLTPVTALTGLPVPVDLVAGVHGAPDGLRFALPATLTVTLPAPPVGVLLGLVIPDGGATLQGVSVARTAPATLTVPVAHFSTIAIPRVTAALLALLPAGTPQSPIVQLAHAAFASGQTVDVQALLDQMIAWYDTRIDPQTFAAADLGAADALRLAWLAEFLAWDSLRGATESIFGHVLLAGTPLRGRLTARATAGRQGAVAVLGNAYGQWNGDCQGGAGLALPARLALADRAARFAVLAEFYFDWLQDNQALTPDVDQAAVPSRDAFGIGVAQIPASFCLRETIAVAAPAVPPNGTGPLRVTAGTVFGAEPPAYGDVMEVAFQPDPTSYAGIQQAPTNTAGEAFFPITAAAAATIRYRACAHYRPPVEAASWVTLLYRLDGVNCRSSVTGVVVSPSQTSIAPGASRQFSVVVEGTPNQAVTWTVDGGGTITATGRFTSNGTDGTFFVRATSVEEANAVGVAQITVGRDPPPPPPSGYPCVDAPCTYSGTWTYCELHPDGVRWLCQDRTSTLGNPEVRVDALPIAQGLPPRIQVAFTCVRTGARSVLHGTVDLSGAFTATQIVTGNCVVGTATGTVSQGSLSFTLPDAYAPDRRVFTFAGTR